MATNRLFGWRDVTNEYRIDRIRSHDDSTSDADRILGNRLDNVVCLIFVWDTGEIMWECISADDATHGYADDMESAKEICATTASRMVSDGRRHGSVRTALWKDVQQKAYRLMQNNDIEIQSISTFSILCEVAGDTEIYDTYVNQRVRVNKNNSISAANWFCTCDWGQWCNTGRRPHDGPDSTGSVKSNNRMCSHAYACYLMLQQYRKLHADEMRDKEPEDDTPQNPGNEMWEDTDTFGDTSQVEDSNEPTTMDWNDTDDFGGSYDDDELDHWYD